MTTVLFAGHWAGAMGRLLYGLAALSARAAVVLVLAAIIALVLRRSSAAVRRWTWVVALAAVALLPALSLLPAWHVSYLPAWTSPHAAHAATLGAGQAPPVPGMFYADAPGQPGGILHNVGNWASAHWLPVAVLLWLFIAVVFAARLLAGCIRTYRIVRQASPAASAQRLLNRVAAQAGIRRRVSLLFSGVVDVPFTWGIVYPVVVLPAHAEEWDDEHVAAVIAHELGHVRSFDWLIQIGGEAVRALHWFNPVVWFALRRLAEESERDCDNNALRYGAKPALYAKQLMGIAGFSARYYPHVAWSGHSGFYNRVHSILDPAVSRQPLPRFAASAVTVVTLLAAVSVATITGRVPRKPTQPAATPAVMASFEPASEIAGALKPANPPMKASVRRHVPRQAGSVKRAALPIRAEMPGNDDDRGQFSLVAHRLPFQSSAPKAAPPEQDNDTFGVLVVVNETSDGIETQTLFFAVYRVIVPPLALQGI